MVCAERVCDRRSLFVKQVRRWGDLNTDAVLDTACQVFSIPSIDGCIGYRIELNCAIVFGEPLCDSADKGPLVDAFCAFCRSKGWMWSFVIVPQEFAKAVSKAKSSVLIQFGNRLILDPSQNPTELTGPKGVLIRKKVKHAKHAGVTIEEYVDHDPAFEQAIEKIADEWLNSRRGPQVYIAHHDFFNDREGKRCFFAQKEGKVVAFLMLNQIEASGGWLLNNLILTLDAPSGTSELLIVTVLNLLAEEGCQKVVVGPVTSTELSSISGLGPVSCWVIRNVFKLALRLFRLDGQRVFWEKFPVRQEPTCLLFEKLSYRTVRALFRALNVEPSKSI